MMTASTTTELRTILRAHNNGVVSKPIQVLCQALHSRYPNSIQAILFYGSCLRSDSDIEGIIDLYLLVDRYQSLYHSFFPALMNTLLPPNVFYIEVPYNERKVRAKYAILSLEDFERSTSMRWFHSYFWARFAQPTKVAYVASPQTQETIEHALAQSIVTFLTRTLPQTPSSFDARILWETGLSLTYQSELRAERPGRIPQLIEANRDYYQNITDVTLSTFFPSVRIDRSMEPTRYEVQLSSFTRTRSRVSWLIRRTQGKLLSILRLIKGLFTFDGGVDYILWKIERHSGVTISLTPWQRKHPLLASPRVLWKLYKKGAFR